ncbi:MAG: tetratricopeptide repeat protein [Methylovulum sp.]|nr:tetratricopeptide repeat protein [Methylovulum sp.]
MTDTTDNTQPEPGPAEIIARFERQGSGPPKTIAIFKYADALRQVRRYHEALQNYELLATLPIPKGKAWLVPLFKGQTFFEMGRFAEAEQAFKDAGDDDPSTASRVYLATALRAQERFEAAIEVLTNALDCEGDRDEVLLNLALNRLSLGQWAAAQNNLEQALAITPDYPSAQTVLEDVRAALALGDGAGSP